jgi:predicted RNase H-like nuclease (RuvC/YqgF family)
MASYTATWVGPPSNPAQQDDVPEAGEAATDPFESWLDWLEEARDAIDQGDGDPDDLDNLLAVILEHIVGGGPDAAALKEKRAEEVLREARDSNRKIATVLRQQREAREQRAVEAAALAGRLNEMTDAIAAAARENAALRSSLSACEQNLTQATAMLEKEIARERSLRRLLDAQRSRPHTQRVASELAKKHAQKALEVLAKGKPETKKTEAA